MSKSQALFLASLVAAVAASSAGGGGAVALGFEGRLEALRNLPDSERDSFLKDLDALEQEEVEALYDSLIEAPLEYGKGGDVGRHLMSDHGMFEHRSDCVPGNEDPCTAKFSALLSGHTGTDPLEVPCGSCAVMDSAGELNLLYGLDVRGKLVFPPNHKVSIFTPFVFVQGEVEITSTEEVSPANLGVKFFLTGTAEQTLTPPNSKVCGGASCAVGKKPFIVAGGKLSVRAFPAVSTNGSECKTWTRLHSIVTSGSKTLEPSQITSVATPPDGCPIAIVRDTFETGPGRWSPGEGNIAGATCDLDNSIMSVSDRVRKYQGPTLDITRHTSCLLPDVPYLLTAKIKLTKEGVSENGNVPTVCKSTGDDCLRVQNWIRYWDGRTSHHTPYASHLKQVRLFIFLFII